jgi:cell division protein FtsB
MRRETRTWVGRTAAAVAVTVALGYIPYHVYARSGLARTLELRRDLRALRARNAQLAADNERLAREAAALRDDPSAVERVARVELGWVRPGEIIVDLTPPPEADKPPGVLPSAPRMASGLTPQGARGVVR